MSCFIQIVKKASQHSQLISQTALLIISYMKGGSEKEDIYFEKCFLDRVREKGIIKNTKALSLRSFEDTYNPILFSLRFFSRIRVGGPSLCEKYVTYFMWRRMNTSPGVTSEL